MIDLSFRKEQRLESWPWRQLAGDCGCLATRPNSRDGYLSEKSSATDFEPEQSVSFRGTIADCARRLNCNDPQDQLSAEWELFVLDAFNKLGRIGHEEDLGCSSRLDLSFYGNSIQPMFVADIRSVSDEGLHKENPVAELQRQLHRHLRKRGIKTGSFQIEVPSIDRLPQLDKKLKLALPPKGQIESFIKQELEGHCSCCSWGIAGE